MPETDFVKLFANYMTIARKEDRAKRFNRVIEPFLQEVADDLSARFAGEGLYPHISNFRTHVTFRLGPDKKMTHRASVGMIFDNGYVDNGFDLTHALDDAKQLRTLFRQETTEIATRILTLKDHTLWMPNAGITESAPIADLSLVKLKRILLKYDPKAMRDCYIRIKRDYTRPTLSKRQMLDIFVRDRNTFAFLLDPILGENAGKGLAPIADEDGLQQATQRIRKRIDLRDKPPGQQNPRRIETVTTTFFRDPIVRAWVLENAKGKCEACRSDAPFLLPDGYPFLEVHHMIPLATGGPDTIENTIALCPNCHRRCHLSKDREVFVGQIYNRVKRLKKQSV